MDNVNEIYVYENWKSDTPSLIGTLYMDGGRGKQVVSFEYVESNWRRLAQQYGLSRSEIEGMAPAFDMEYKE